MAIDVAAIRAKLAAKVANTMAAEKNAVARESEAKAVATGVAPIATAQASQAPVATAPITAVVPVPATAPLPVIAQDDEYADLTPQQFSVVEKIEQIKQMLLTSHPLMPSLLKQVHAAIHKDPELVHFLKPDQIGAIVKGCMFQTKVVITAAAVTKSKTTSGKKLSSLTLADI